MPVNGELAKLFLGESLKVMGSLSSRGDLAGPGSREFESFLTDAYVEKVITSEKIKILNDLKW